jgi:two-component system, NarL family, response regulator NreC
VGLSVAVVGGKRIGFRVRTTQRPRAMGKSLMAPRHGADAMHIRLVIAEDFLIVREGLRALLERHGFDVLADVADGAELIDQIETLRPDIAVLDFSLPLMNGLDAARAVTRLSPDTKPVLLTRHDGDQYVLAAIQAGVRGYVLKSQSACDLVEAIREVWRGGVYLSPGVSQSLAEAFVSHPRVDGEALTARERQVLQLIAEEKTTKEVASILGVSVKTAESHRLRLMRKLDIHATAGLVRYAIRHGLIEA